MATIILPRSLIALFPEVPRRCEVDATTDAEPATLETALRADSTLHIIPAVSGG